MKCFAALDLVSELSWCMMCMRKSNFNITSLIVSGCVCVSVCARVCVGVCVRMRVCVGRCVCVCVRVRTHIYELCVYLCVCARS